MSVLRLAAVVLIFIATAVAWAILGATIVERTSSSHRDLYDDVGDLWGTSHSQQAPAITYVTQERETYVDDEGNSKTRVVDYSHGVSLLSTRLQVDLALEHRRKGLLWFATYSVAFDGTFTFENPTDVTREFAVDVNFPSETAIYDAFGFSVDGEEYRPSDRTQSGVRGAVVLAPGEQSEVSLTYCSRGLDEWRYSFGYGVSDVHDFSLVVNTNFDDYDFPSGSMSATMKEDSDGGARLTWTHEDLVTGYDVGVLMPERINPGEMASRMTFFAPVSLLFFFTVLVIVSAVRKVGLHPMHYFFLAASFFAFHLLFAYLVDHVVLELSFAISCVVSLALVFTYLRLVTGWRFAFMPALVAQFLYLCLFSFAFFFVGYTGLTVAIGSVVTLFILMQYTGRVDWGEVFKKVPTKS